MDRERRYQPLAGQSRQQGAIKRFAQQEPWQQQIDSSSLACPHLTRERSHLAEDSEVDRGCIVPLGCLRIVSHGGLSVA